MKVLVTDSISKEGLEILKEAGITVEERPGITQEDLLNAISDADGLIIRSNTKVTEEVVAAAQRLKVVGRAGSGLDNVNIPACNKRGIVVMNTPGGNTNSAAEHTMAMIMSISRHIPQATASMKAGKWEKKRFMGQELAGKCLGIVGIGRIGSILAQRAQCLGMTVIAYDPHALPDMVKQLGVSIMELDELLAKADYISIHTPLTPETKGMFDASKFALMKKGAYIVNCARGGVINEKDLYDALVSGHLAGAALDVFEKEPTSLEGTPLLSLDNFICTPHLGASTREAQENVAVAVARQIADYLIKGEIRNAVNVPSVSAETMAKIGPFLSLAEKLGAFQTNLATGPMEEIQIIYQGELAELDSKPITISAIKGVLTPILKEEVNFVNALMQAKDRGIQVTETKNVTSEEFTNLLTIRVRTKDGNINEVAGTIFGKKEPRIVRINDFRLEAALEGHILLIYNEDRPGVIGRIGMCLGNAGINIARMQVGQDHSHKRNVILLSTDEMVTSEIITNLMQQDGVSRVKAVEL